MELQVLEGEFSVCQVADGSQIDWRADFLFFGKTDEEISLVCRSGGVPSNVTARDDGWRALRVAGSLDFSLVGVLAGLSKVLAENGIGIFAVSTFRTDYILTKAENFPRALAALARAGCRVTA